MTEGNAIFVVFLFGVVIGVCLFIIVALLSGNTYKNGHEVGYKQGQVDYALGNVRYVLVKQPSSETVWEEVKK